MLLLIMSMLLTTPLSLLAQESTPESEMPVEVVEPTATEDTGAPVTIDAPATTDEVTEPSVPVTDPNAAPAQEAPAEVAPLAEQTSRVSFAMSSADPTITAIGPNSSWSLTPGVTMSPLYFRDNTALPQTYTSPWLYDVPFGTQTLTIDAGAQFELFTMTVDINTPEQVIQVVLQPKAGVNSGYFTFQIASADPTTANRLPVATSYQLINSDGQVVHRQAGLPTFLPQTLQAPSFASPALPFGDYTVVITPPSAFQRYEATFTLGAPNQTEQIILQPVAVPSPTATMTPSPTATATATPSPSPTTVPVASRVYFDMSSSDPSITQLGPNATWSLSPEVSTKYFRDNRALPQVYGSAGWLWDIPYGTYTLTIDGGAEFELYTATVVIDDSTETIPIVLQPRAEVGAGYFTFDISSADPSVANRLPVGTSFQLLNSSGEIVHRGAGLPTFLPQTLQSPAFSSEELPYGEYTLRINPPSIFEAYEATFTLGQAYQQESVVLQPILPSYAGTVTVVEADGVTPVAGATVTLVESGETLTTDANGVVRFSDLENGTYAVAVRAVDGRASTGALLIDGSDAATTVMLAAVNTAITVSIVCPDLTGARIGDEVIVQMTVTNTGNVAMTSARATIYQTGTRQLFYANPPIPRTMEPGDTVTTSVAYVIDDTEANAGMLRGSAQVSAVRPNGTYLNANTSMSQCTFAPVEDFELSATCPSIPDDIAVGDPVTIEVTATNTGDARVITPTVTTNRPERFPTVLTIGYQGSRTVQYTTYVTQADMDAGDLNVDVTMTAPRALKGPYSRSASVSCELPEQVTYGWPRGFITDAEGNRIPGATVTIEGENHNGPLTYTTTADSTGVYKSGAQLLTGTTATVTVSAPGYVTQTQPVTVGVGPTDLNFEMERQTWTVSGTLTQGGNRRPVSNAQVCITSLGICTTSDAKGKFALEGVPDGTYEVTITATQYKTTTSTITVDGGDVTRDVVMKRGRP